MILSLVAGKKEILDLQEGTGEGLREVIARKLLIINPRLQYLLPKRNFGVVKSQCSFVTTRKKELATIWNPPDLLPTVSCVMHILTNCNEMACHNLKNFGLISGANYFQHIGLLVF